MCRCAERLFRHRWRGQWDFSQPAGAADGLGGSANYRGGVRAVYSGELGGRNFRSRRRRALGASGDMDLGGRGCAGWIRRLARRQPAVGKDNDLKGARRCARHRRGEVDFCLSPEKALETADERSARPALTSLPG